MALALNTFHTPLGWCVMLGEQKTLLALTFGHSSLDAAVRWLDDQIPEADASKAQAVNWNPQLAKRIVAMLRGIPDDFRDVKIDDSHLTPFSRRVVNRCRAIKWGETRSYGQLAAAAGSPGAARAVGHVMSTNRFPLVVPCHRVVASDGRLGGYSAPQGLATKRRLLELEAACACC